MILKICSPQLGLNPNSDLGGEVHDHNVITGLARKGHKIFVYLPKNRNYQKHKNIIVSRAPFKHISAFAFNILVIPYLFKTYRREKFDILRVHNPYFVGLGALLFKFFHKNVSLVTTYHLVEEGFFFDLINRFTARRYDATIAVSNYVRKWPISEYTLDSYKVPIIYNGVSEQFRPHPKNNVLLQRYKIKNRFAILYMGLLIYRKNPLFLLKVFKQLKKTNYNLTLLICGKGPLKSHMEKYIRENHINDVIFVGVVQGQNKIDHFNLCDIFVLPSKNEGFGMVVAEAMKCAKPVVVSRNTSLLEIVEDEVDGLFANTNSSKEWSEKINDLIKNPILRKKMGEAAYKKISEKFSWRTSINLHEKLLIRLINA